jgi:hypothetical protein
MGVPVGFDQVSVTKPYYRSTYALVFPKGKGLDQVKSGDDFLKLDPAKLRALRIGVYDRSPASDWLNLHQPGRPRRALPDHERRPAAVPGRDHREGPRGRQDRRRHRLGPDRRLLRAARQVAQLTVVPLKSEPGVRFDYEMAMGVRYGEREWKQQIEGLIDSQQAEIQAILKDYGVPLVDDSFAYKAPAKNQPAK